MILLEHLSVSEYFGDSSEGHLENNEGDPELLIFIPFTSDVKIKSISIVGGADGTSPSKMRAFINREGIDFSDAQSMQSVHEWDLAENLQGVLEYQTKYSRFQGVGNLTLHFPNNFGGDTTRIIYIGLKGEATQLKRDVVATIVYEIMPNPSDHKTKAFIHCAIFGEITKLIDVFLVDKLNPTDWRRLLAHGILCLGSIYHRCVHYDGCGECPITGPQFKSKGQGIPLLLLLIRVHYLWPIEAFMLSLLMALESFIEFYLSICLYIFQHVIAVFLVPLPASMS